METFEGLKGVLGEFAVLKEALLHRLDVAVVRLVDGTNLGFLGSLSFKVRQLLLEDLELLLFATLDGTVDVAQFFLQHLAKFRQSGVTSFHVHEGDHVGGEVDDLLELFGLELFLRAGAHEEVGQPGTSTAQVPDVHDRSRQLDVAHAVATHLVAGDFDATALTDDALETHALVLATGTFPRLLRSEDLLAEESVLLGAQRAVVDGLGLLDFA